MTLHHAALPLHHLDCAGGTTTIERTLGRVPGVIRVYVNPVTEMAYVEYDRDRCDERVLADTLARAGYGDRGTGHGARGPAPRAQVRAARGDRTGRLAAVVRRVLHLGRSTT